MTVHLSPGVHAAQDNTTGEMKPTKKGLSMPTEQYMRLLAGVDAINAALQQGGAEVSRPHK